MYRSIYILFLLAVSVAHAQPSTYTAGNLHSHNDYEKPFPFWEAYNQGFGSIEADIFLKNGQLIIAHDTVQLKRGRTLDSFYLNALQQCLTKNNGYPYGDHSKTLQLLIDVKTDSVATLNALVKKLSAYPLITKCKNVKLVISGNRPAAANFADYPQWIYFDGELHLNYSPKSMSRIEMLSDNFRNFSTWNGIDTMPARDQQVIKTMVAKAHLFHKKVRFWNAPDIINSWKVFMALGVDYINTDHITAATVYLQSAQP